LQGPFESAQDAARKDRRRLAAAKLVGSMGRRGNPHDNAMMASLMKTVKVEGVYPLAVESEDHLAEHRPRFIEAYDQRRLHSSLGDLGPAPFDPQHTRPPAKTAA